VTENTAKVYEVLKELEIPYTRYEHKPAYTIADLEGLGDISSCICKNLFVRNQKGNRHFLVIIEQTKKANLADLAEKIGSTKLSFGSERRLEKYLGLKPGAVSPFGLINDENKQVEVVVDEDLKKTENVGFHPNANTETLIISFSDFEKYLKWCNNKVKYIKL
jgi:Ala-tRNA(Pro) deacylase